MPDQINTTSGAHCRGDDLIAAGIKPLSPWELLQSAGVVVDLAWAELLSAKTGCSVQFWLNMQEGYERPVTTTIHKSSREERTLRAMFLIARRLYKVTSDFQDWQSVIMVESLIDECVEEELNHG